MNRTEKNLSSLLDIHARGNVSDLLYQRISGLIMSGELEEGYVFPNEAVLCEQLQVGRTTLREAYKALEFSGYVTRTKRGTSVNSHSTILSSTPLKTIFQMCSPKDFNQYRLMVEMEGAYLAACHAEPEDLKQLGILMKQSGTAWEAKDFGLLIDLDAQFHCKIATMSQNSLMIATVSVMTEAWEKSIRRNFSAARESNPQVLDTMLAEHDEIITAIQTHDCDRSRMAMREHILHMTNKRDL